MQTKKQKREKVLAYLENELRKDFLPHNALYIKGQIAILRRKLTLREPDATPQSSYENEKERA
jgi:hypothetical protein